MNINDKIIDEVVESCRQKFGGVDCFPVGVGIRDVANHALSAYNKARYKPVKNPDDVSPSPAGVSSRSRERESLTNPESVTKI